MGGLGSRASGPDDVARRRFIRRAAGATAVAALVLPTIVSVDPAAAAGLTSPPPDVGPDETPTGAPAGVNPRTLSSGQLPFTGVDVESKVAAGIAAIASGTALIYWSARLPELDPDQQPIGDAPTAPEPSGG